jgi:hypothetical protein
MSESSEFRTGKRRHTRSRQSFAEPGVDMGEPSKLVRAARPLTRSKLVVEPNAVLIATIKLQADSPRDLKRLLGALRAVERAASVAEHRLGGEGYWLDDRSIEQSPAAITFRLVATNNIGSRERAPAVAEEIRSLIHNPQAIQSKLHPFNCFDKCGITLSIDLGSDANLKNL